MTLTIVPKKKQNIILDATMLSTLMSCPCLVDLRFNRSFRSIDGWSNSLECGSLVHKILEVFARERIKGFDRTTSISAGMIAGQTYIAGCPDCYEFEAHDCITCKGELTQVTFDKDEGITSFIKLGCQDCNGTGRIDKPRCGHQPNEYPGLKNTPPDSESKPKKKIGWRWVLETMEQYFDYRKNDFWVPLEVEIVKKKILYQDDNIRILWKAKLDLLEDTTQGIYPVDHKTMQQKRPTVSLNNQFMGQCHVADTQSVIINKIGFQTSLKPEDKFIRDMISYSTHRLLEWQSVTLPYYAYEFLTFTETGYWPQRFSHCENKYGICQFKEVCGTDPEMREDVLRQNFIVGEKWDPTNPED